MCVYVCTYSSNYDPVQYNGTEDSEDAKTKTEGVAGKGGEGGQNPEKFSFSDLPRLLDYSSGEEKETPSGVGGASTDEHSRDQMALALRELGTSTRLEIT